METLEKIKPKIVALWASPRSVSTAFEKTFSQRSDTEIVHEPFCDIYYFSQWNRSDRFSDLKKLENYSSADAIKKILRMKTPLTFVKDHAYQVLPYVNRQFFASLTNTFIIRDPQEVIASWYRVEEYPTEEEFGFTAIDKTWQIVVEELGEKPIVVEANRFRSQPEKTLQLYCENIGVKFEPKMLNWQNGKLQNWNKREAQFHAKWHSTLNDSKGILPPIQEIVKIRPQEQEIVAKAMKIYEKMNMLFNC